MSSRRLAGLLASVCAVGIVLGVPPAAAQNTGQTYRLVYECTDFVSCWSACVSTRGDGTPGEAQALRSRDLDDSQLQFRFVQIERVFWGDEPAYLNPPLAGPVMVRFMWSAVPVPDRATDPAGYYRVTHEVSLLFFDPNTLNCQFSNMTVVQF